MPTHRWLAAFIGLNALAAWGGAVALITGAIALGDTLERRLPLHSPVLGGCALVLVVAAPLTLVAVDAWRGAEATPEAARVSGVLLLGWIVVQYGFLRAFSPLQPFYLVLGAGLVAWSRHLRAETPQLS